ncbi:MAG TPA: hypothetical protein DCM87_22200 [Planctomycetes bacterium]|nr:hypothetical protein [Planctomycetota bacterium]
MKIKFVGTSNANPHPGRSQTCIHVEANGLGHVLDCGDGAATKLWLDGDIDWSCLRALLVTHLHPDHASGAFALLHLLHQRARENPSWGIHDREAFKLCVPDGKGAHRFTQVLGALHVDRDMLAYNLNYEYYRAGMVFTAGGLKITAYPTSHCEDAHSLCLEAEGKRIVFSGDLAEPAEITEHAGGADLLICECAHFHPRQLVPELAAMQASHYVITHMHDDLLADPEATESLFLPLTKAGKVTLAQDGLVLEL